MSTEEELAIEVAPDISGEQRAKVIAAFKEQGVDTKNKLKMMTEDDVKEIGLRKFNQKYLIDQIQNLSRKDDTDGGVNVHNNTISGGQGTMVGVLGGNIQQQFDKAGSENVPISGGVGRGGKVEQQLGWVEELVTKCASDIRDDDRKKLIDALTNLGVDSENKLKDMTEDEVKDIGLKAANERYLNKQIKKLDKPDNAGGITMSNVKVQGGQGHKTGVIWHGNVTESYGINPKDEDFKNEADDDGRKRRKINR